MQSPSSVSWEAGGGDQVDDVGADRVEHARDVVEHRRGVELGGERVPDVGVERVQSHGLDIRHALPGVQVEAREVAGAD